VTEESTVDRSVCPMPALDSTRCGLESGFGYRLARTGPGFGPGVCWFSFRPHWLISIFCSGRRFCIAG